MADAIRIIELTDHDYYVGSVGSEEARAICAATGCCTKTARAEAGGYYYAWCDTCNRLVQSGPLPSFAAHHELREAAP